MPMAQPRPVTQVQLAPGDRKLSTAYLIFFLTSMIGFHMFYFRNPLMAIAKILTINFFFIGMVVDVFLMPRYVRQANSR
jgi:TM2 domain-containing membrane protein YozV